MAQRWTKKAQEEYAIEVRGELRLGPHHALDPVRLATEYGIPVYPLDELADFGCSQEAIEYFLSERPSVWSAALVPCGTGRFIIENTVHEPPRRRSNVAHEMAHLLLEHDFDGILWTNEECRAQNPAIEKEAKDFAGELLIPRKAAIKAAFADRTNEEVAAQFDVSVKFAQWRMDASGARTIARRARGY